MEPTTTIYLKILIDNKQMSSGEYLPGKNFGFVQQECFSEQDRERNPAYNTSEENKNLFKTCKKEVFHLGNVPFNDSTLNPVHSVYIKFFGDRRLSCPSYDLVIQPSNLVNINGTSERFLISQNFFMENKLAAVSFRDFMEKKDHYSKVLVLTFNGGHTWQHFMANTLPLLVYSRDFLKDNPDINLLLYEPHFDSLLEILKRLEIVNKVIWVSPVKFSHFSVDTIYISNYYPSHHADDWHPKPMLELTQQSLHKYDGECTNLVYFNRGDSVANNRSLHNQELLKHTLKKLAERKNLNFIDFYHGKYSPEERFNIMEQTKIAVGCHGGALYHMFFFKSNTTMIEIVFPEDDKTYNTEPKSKLDLSPQVRNGKIEIKDWKEGCKLRSLHYLGNGLDLNYFIVKTNNNNLLVHKGDSIDNIQYIMGFISREGLSLDSADIKYEVDIKDIEDIIINS